MAKCQGRLYKVTDHVTGNIRLVYAYNRWQAIESIANIYYGAEVVRGYEAALLTEQGYKIEYVAPKEE